MAPEVALSKPYSHKAEVFAFATVLWEMASHERPYSEYDVKGFYKCAATPRLPSRSFCRTDASFWSPRLSPPHDLPRPVVLRRVCSAGQRPPISQSFPPQLATLLTRCWSTDHAARPEMAEVIVILRELIVQLSPNPIRRRLGSR